jgi:putative colanic acid biosynthesis glycosyltransferase
VITISYRDLPGLERTLASVQGQRGEFATEHIVIDGGSGTDVERFLRSEDSRLAYWQSQPDDGRYAAMNEGIGRATGHMLWFMHSGDRFSDEGAVAAALAALDTEIQCGWGFGRARLTNGNRRGGREWGFDRFGIRRFALGDRPVPHLVSCRF